MNRGDNPDRLLAVVSPDFDDYTSGAIDASQVQCLMCQQRGCQPNGCLEFASPAYMARLNEIHGGTDR